MKDQIWGKRNAKGFAVNLDMNNWIDGMIFTQ